MFKLVTFVTLFAAAFSAPQHAAQYPAGVDPAKCPGFPICDNAALHNTQPAHNHWNAQPAHNQWNPQPAHNQWNPQPAAPQWNQWNPQPAAHNHWNAQPAAPQWNQVAAPAPKGGDKYPAGVDPHKCPNFPYCPTPVIPGAPAHHQAAPLPGFTERLYPAGVSAHQCPNYPEC